MAWMRQAKGAGKQSQVASSTQMLEGQYTAACSHIYDGLMDLNVSTPQLLQPWKDLLTMRNSLLQSYGIKVSPAELSSWSPALGAPPAAGGDVDIDWKSKLFQEVSKRSGRALTKGELVFTVTPDEARGFICSATAVTQGLFLHQAEYHCTVSAASKKLAEHGAAREAFTAEFPAVAQALQGGYSAKPVQGTKRKSPGAEPDSENAKSRLMRMIQVMIGRPITKGEIMYECWPIAAADGKDTSPPVGYQALVKIPGYDENAVWQGEQATSKKDAESSAAAMAAETLAPIAKPVEDELKAKKARLSKDKLEVFKQQKAAQKAGQAAIGGEAVAAA